MTKSWCETRQLPIVGMAAMAMLAVAVAANGQTWSERTTITISAPVTVPGATLQPGSYEFRLVPSDTTDRTVQISSEDGRVITTTTTVPVKRDEPSPDTILSFNPTPEGEPPVIKAWFYPGSVYGHEFVYPDAQAREIAARTKTIVLANNPDGPADEQGTLYTYDAAGTRGEWRGWPSSTSSSWPRCV